MVDRVSIWKKIAKAYGTPHEERTPEQRKLTQFGLCHAHARLLGANFAPISSYLVIIKKFKESTRSDAFWYPIRGYKGFKDHFDTCRMVFASFLAALSKKEYEELLSV